MQGAGEGHQAAELRRLQERLVGRDAAAKKYKDGCRSLKERCDHLEQVWHAAAEARMTGGRRCSTPCCKRSAAQRTLRLPSCDRIQHVPLLCRAKRALLQMHDASAPVDQQLDEGWRDARI